MESIIIWTLVLITAAIILIPYVVKFRKQQKLNAERKSEAQNLGIDRPRAQFPFIDESQCIGCGSCVSACPEGDVLGIVFGKATVINGLRCVGHSLCEDACPVGAIEVGLGDTKSREDIPQMNEYYETNVPGIYIAGELGGLSLIRNAIEQGKTTINRIADAGKRSSDTEVKDVIIVGAGPAGLTAALTAEQHNLSYMLLDQQEPGGTILQYPRKKLVMTQPVEIPLYGKLTKNEYSKEILLETWQEIIHKYSLKIHSMFKVNAVTRENGNFKVLTENGDYHAQNVLLAMGRRGTPRKLGVPGENQSKVLYQLIDSQSYQNNNLLVVGGGDSAIEAAVGLARQPGNKVTISYRKSKFFRIKKKNEDNVSELIRQKKIRPIFDSNMREIAEKSVKIETPDELVEIANDFVFIFAGGIPPFKMLKEMGIAFGGEQKN